MEDGTKKLIQQQYAKLPKQLQDAIQSSHVNEMIGAIAAQNKLHIDQIEVFENEVMMLMMGFTDPIAFVSELQKELGISADAALKIATETNEQILLPIREKMENTTSDAVTTSPIPTNAPAVSTPPTAEKSVVMPSASKAPEVAKMPTVIPTPAPSAITPAAPTTPSVPEIIKPVGLPMMPHVDAMLAAPTVSIAPKPVMQTVAPSVPAAPVAPAPTEVAKTEPPKPGPIYKTDPYHEPVD